MPYGPPAADGLTLARERAAWQRAARDRARGGSSPRRSARRASRRSPRASPRCGRWFRPWLRATLAGTTPPPMPATSVASPALVTLVWYLVAILALIGVSGWLRFTMASMRTAALARYPSRHHGVATCVLFFLPLVGPLVAMSASKGCLPTGHEARRTLTIGWWLRARRRGRVGRRVGDGALDGLDRCGVGRGRLVRCVLAGCRRAAADRPRGRRRRSRRPRRAARPAPS